MVAMIVRPDCFKTQAQFTKHTMRREWKQIIRLRASKNLSSETYQWCVEHTNGRWTRADGADFYYFEEDADAVYFRLRWAGQHGKQND